MTDQDPRLQQAIDFIKQGDKLQARSLLTQLITEDKFNPQYWLWMSGVVTTQKERIYCLKEVIKLDPENPTARFGLQIFGELPPDPSLAIPTSRLKRDWQKQFEPTKPPKPPRGKAVGKVLGFVGMLAVLLVAGYFLVNLTIGSFHPAPTLKSILGATATASITPSPEPAKYTPTPSGPEPLWMLLSTTYTPTPLYLATPHPLLEAYSTGMRAYLRGDWQNVINYMQQVIDSEKNAWDAKYMIGEAYRFMGDYQQAFDTFTGIIQDNGSFAPAFLGRARTRLQGNIGKWQQAQSDLEQAVKLDANLGEAHLELGALYATHGLPDTAIIELDFAGSLIPDSPQVYYYKGIAYLALNDTSSALAAAQKANDLDITFLNSYLLLGMAYQAEGRNSASLKPMQTYTLYEKKNSQAFILLGSAYASTGDNESALEAFDNAITLDSKNADAYILRGNLYLDLQAGDKSLSDFQKAWSFNTKSFDSNMGIGMAYMVLQQYGNAYIQFNKTESLARLDAQKAELYFWRAQSLELLDQKDAAILDWNRLLDLPADALTPKQKTTAEEHLARLAIASATITSTPTNTETPSKTPTPGKATSTPTATVPAATDTPTPTLKPSPTKTP